MTETELNEALLRIEQQRLESLPAPPKRKSGRRYRRQMCVRKNDRLMWIVTQGYLSHVGYVDGDFEGKTLLHSGRHIKRPKNSNCQRWIKRETSRKIRNSNYAPRKGNYHRRLFDYWGTLY